MLIIPVSILQRSGWAVVLAAALLGAPPTSAIVTEFGSGPDFVDLIIEEDAFGPDPLHYRYAFTHNESAPLDGYDLLQQVDAAFTDISFSFSNFGSASEPNYFLNAITYQSLTLTNASSSPFTPYWAQWVSGGEAGFPEAEPVDLGTWTMGSGMSRPYRVLTPFASEGYVFNDGSTPPSTQPVPEPGTVALLALGGIATWMTRRRGSVLRTPRAGS